MSPLSFLCPGCGAIASRQGRCTDCKRAADRRRGTRTERGYDNRWLRLSDEAIRRHPYCHYCGSAEDLTGDHRIPRSKGGVAMTADDVIVACRSCNGRRGNREEGGRFSGAAVRNPLSNPARISVIPAETREPRIG